MATKRCTMRNKLNVKSTPGVHHQLLAALLETTNTAIFLVDYQGTIEMHNAAAQGMFERLGRARGQVKIDELLPRAFSRVPNGGQSVDLRLDPVYQDGKIHGTTIVPRPGDKEISIELRVKRYDADGTLKYVVRVRDITER
jgi:PAS domain-containing protein